MGTESEYDGQVVIKFTSGELKEDNTPKENELTLERGVQALCQKWEKGGDREGRKKDVAVVSFVKATEDALNKQGKDSDSKKALVDAIKDLPKNSRVYIVGHGDSKPDHVGGWKNDEVDNLLKECNLTQDKTAIISVVSCQAALGPLKWPENFKPSQEKSENFGPFHKLALDAGEGPAEENALNNFVAKFHKALGEGEKSVKCRMFGRVFNVKVVTSELVLGQLKQYQGNENIVVGRKITRNDFWKPIPKSEAAPNGAVAWIKTPNASFDGMRDYSQKQKESKREYSWDGGKQTWKWVDYGDRANMVRYPIPSSGQSKK